MFTCRRVKVGERKVSSIIIDRTRTGNLSLNGRRGTGGFSPLYSIRKTTNWTRANNYERDLM